MVEIMNEGDLFSKTRFILPEPYKTEFTEKFDQWLKEKSIDKKATDFDVLDCEDETLMDFKIDLQEKYYHEMYSCMRDCGVKIPITGTNWTITPANLKTQLVTDFIDNHPYLYDWRWGEFEGYCANTAITAYPTSYLTKTALC